MIPDLELALTERAWKDRDFANSLREDPAAALKTLGVTVPEGVKLDIRVQDINTLYHVIPPYAGPELPSDRPIDQIDLWRSSDIFTWILPESLKWTLLAMRQQHRKFEEASVDN